MIGPRFDLPGRYFLIMLSNEVFGISNKLIHGVHTHATA
jgi:hypothetical protein